MINLQPVFRLGQIPAKPVVILEQGVSNDALNYFKNEARIIKPSLSIVNGIYKDLSFLMPHRDWLYGVYFDGARTIDWKTINSLRALTSLKLGEAIDTSGFNPSGLSHLKWFHCYWAENSEEILKAMKALESLLIRSYKSEDFECISSMRKLKNLEIAYSRKLKSVEGIQHLKQLEFLWLSTNSQLTQIQEIAQCRNLKTLCIAENNKATGYECIADLTNLEELILNAKVPSLKWIKSLKKLRILRFDCTIEDGDIKFLHEMESLQHVYFRQKRNLNVKLKDIENELLEKGYNPKSTEPDYGSFRRFPDHPPYQGK